VLHTNAIITFVVIDLPADGDDVIIIIIIIIISSSSSSSSSSICIIINTNKLDRTEIWMLN